MSFDQVAFPLISPSLSREECITQSFLILEQFAKDFGKFTTNINNQINSRTEKLSKIKARIATVDEKIKNINNSKKAIRLNSPSSFPRSGPTQRNDLVVKVKEGLSVDFKYKLPNESTAASKAFKSPAVSFDLFFSKVDSPRAYDGIGIPPKDIKNSGNLLIYNTSINAYKNKAMVNPLDVAVKATRPEKTEHVPDQAPETVALGQKFDLMQRLNFDYNPTLGDVPKIEVPDSLPDLMGIVSDLKYSGDQNELGIAPSIILTEIAVDLPEMDSEVIDSMAEDPNISSTIANVPVLTPDPTPQTRTNPVPSVQEEKKEVTPQPKIPEPLPEVESPKIAPPVEISPMRSLLDSIVNAGGSEKFKFNPKKEETDKPIEPPKEVDEPMDVMSQLRKVLKRRGDSLRGAPPVVDVPKSTWNETPSFAKSISKLIKTESLEEDENEDNWSD